MKRPYFFFVCASVLGGFVQLASAMTFNVPTELADDVKAAKEAEERKAAGNTAYGDVTPEATTQEQMPAETVTAVEPELVENTAVIEEPAVDEPVEAGTGRLSGQVFDKESGTALRGVAVLLEGTDMGTITDASGRFRITSIPVNVYTVSFIKSGYIAANVTDTQVVEGDTAKLDFALPPRPAEMSDEVYELQDFTVTAEEVASQNVALLALRQQSIASIDALSSEDFAKFAASDAAEAISRISGASISDGKYVVMRGLNDRYNTTLINGVRLPSPDPDRKAVAMDLFPTSLFETIVARKTYTSDMPGESSGGSIELLTKSVPDEPFIKFGFGVGGQVTDSTTEDFLSDPEQVDVIDWIEGKDPRGFDLVPGTNELVDDYPTEVGGVDFPLMAPTSKKLSRFGDRNYSFSMGGSKALTDQLSVGAIFGTQVKTKKRTKSAEIYEKGFEQGQVVLEERGLYDQGGGGFESEEEYTSSILLGLGANVSDHTSVDYTYLRAESLSSKVKVIDYQEFESEPPIGIDGADTIGFYNKTDYEITTEERLLEAHQFSGEHVFAMPLTKSDWTLGLYYTSADMKQAEPDQRVIEGFYSDTNQFDRAPGLQPVYRFQRETDQESTMMGFDLSTEIELTDSITLSLVFGYDSEESERDFRQLEAVINEGVGVSLIDDPLFAAMPYPDVEGITNFDDDLIFSDEFAGVNKLIEGLYELSIDEKTSQFSFTNADKEDVSSVIDSTDLSNSFSVAKEFQDALLSFNEDLDTKVLADFQVEVVPLLDLTNMTQSDLIATYGGEGVNVGFNDLLNGLISYTTSLEKRLEAEDELAQAEVELNVALSNGGFGVMNYEDLFGEPFTSRERTIELLNDGSNNGSMFSDADQSTLYTFLLYETFVNQFSDALTEAEKFDDLNTVEGTQFAEAFAEVNAGEAELNQITKEFEDYMETIGMLGLLAGSNAMEAEADTFPTFSFFGDQNYIFSTPRGFSIYADETPQSTQFDSVGAYYQARGENRVQSFYISGDVKFDKVRFFDSIRIAGGLRSESTQLSYELIPNAPGEPGSISTIVSGVNPAVVAPSEIDQRDNLTYVSFIVDITEDIKLSLSTSKTVAKPTFREVAPFPIFNLSDRSFEVGNGGLTLKAAGNDDDNDGVGSVVEDWRNRTGNFEGVDDSEVPDQFVVPVEFAGLDIADVESHDIRLEYFTPFDGRLAIGYFEKAIGAPIERVLAYQSGGFDVNTFINNDNDAELSGFEFEIDQNLGILHESLSFLTIGGNFTAIDAEVTRSTFEQDNLTNDRFAGQLKDDGLQFQEGGVHGTRPLYNQPEYVANAYVSFNIERTGTLISISNQWLGDQLYRAGAIGSDQTGSPDLYWSDFSALNLVIEQKIGEHWKLRFSAKNINDPVRELYEDDIFFNAVTDPTLVETAGGAAVDPVEFRSFNEQQTVKPTYSISVSGTF